MTDLLLEIWSVADMDLGRAASVGRAFDDDPELRPLRVGGDPARIRVEPSLEELIRRTGLPIDWLTVRTNSRRDGFEGGRIALRSGRGSFYGWPQIDGSEGYALWPHVVEAGFLRSWADAEADRLERIAALFVRIVDAMHACYGIATVLPRSRAMPPVDVGLGDIGWLNYLGPAFVERWPGVAATGVDTQRLANDGVVIRIAPTPWRLDQASRQPVIDAVGEEAFMRELGPYRERGVRVPSMDDHMRFSPGTSEMPWHSWLQGKAAATAERSRERRYAAARRRRESAQKGRVDLEPVARRAEWSTSLDADDWRSLGRRLFRHLGGELTGPIGRALLEEIASAPVDVEESLVLAADIGAIEVRWFIEDIDTVAVFFFGPSDLPPLIDTAYQRWSEG